ncbi:MAG: hypothetical protein QXG26_00535 [Candidatus Aenigmatarchaeota archaeon]
MRGIERDIILVIFSLLMLMIVIVIVAVRVWPLLKYGPFSPCWAVASSKVGELTLLPWEKEKSETITIGDCVSFLKFVNSRQGFCEEEEAKGYIIITPIMPKEEKKWYDYLKIWHIPGDIKDAIQKWWKEELGGIKEECINMDMPFCQELSLEGEEGGQKVYCITIKREKGCFAVSSIEGECEGKTAQK